MSFLFVLNHLWCFMPFKNLCWREDIVSQIPGYGIWNAHLVATNPDILKALRHPPPSIRRFGNAYRVAQGYGYMHHVRNGHISQARRIFVRLKSAHKCIDHARRYLWHAWGLNYSTFSVGKQISAGYMVRHSSLIRKVRNVSSFFSYSEPISLRISCKVLRYSRSLRGQEYDETFA
jgi:hypothetical protein